MVEYFIEHCVNCESHKWTTRHNEAKYKQFAEEIQFKLGGPDKCWINTVPGSWLGAPLIQSLQIDFQDPNSDKVAVRGRMATFEIYANLGAPQGKTAIVHLFSKLLSGYWPNFEAAANRSLRAMSESEQGASLQELEQKYTTRATSMASMGTRKTRSSVFRSTSATIIDRANPSDSQASIKFAPN